MHWGQEGDFNSIALLTSRGSEAQLHHKIHLVPFGGYVPLRAEFPLLARIIGELVPDDFDPGKKFTLLEMEAKPVKLGPLVCFEDTLGDLARHFAELGAQAFVVVTNDGWFNESSGSLQHVRNALFRCVENNIPMMQLMSILSYNAAKHLGDTGLKFMQERGRIQSGMVADIVVFDPERFTDNSTYDKGAVPSTGMKAVIVNGQIAVKDDKVLPVFAGQPIRFEPEAKPRFEPISLDGWNSEFSTGMPDVTSAFPEAGSK